MMAQLGSASPLVTVTCLSFLSPSVRIWAKVLDDKEIERLWVVLYPPSYQLPDSSDEIVPEPDRLLLFRAREVPYGAEYVLQLENLNLDETGEYKIVVYAEDDEGLIARPPPHPPSLGG